MNKIKYAILPMGFFLLLGFASLSMRAQNILGIEEAIKIGLEKNHDILIAKNEAEISKTQNNAGNAGMSPTVGLNGTLGLANVNSHQEFSTGVIQDRPGANSNNFGASLNVGWIVFDGMKMFAIKKRLNLTEELTALQLKEQMEETVYNIIIAYYDVVRLNNLLKAGKQNLSLYEERKKVVKLKLDIGSDSKVDLLLTQSDENKAKSELMQLELQILQAKVNLNMFLVRPADVDFTTTDSITINYQPKADELKKTTGNNTSLLITQKNQSIAEQSVKEARSANMPVVQLNGAYNFTRNQSQAGFVFLNRQLGLNGGLTASWLLFNGNKNKKLIEERQIRLLSQKHLIEQKQQQIDGIVFLNYQVYLTNQKIMELEKQNLADSKEVLMISMERYKLGKTNLLETIQTQKNVEDAKTRYINSVYNTKKAETELLKANGQLIK